jgi:thymidylate synthase
MELQYLDILRDVRFSGNGRQTRNGITVAKFAYQMRHDLRNGFPLLTTKFLSWKLILAELIWFLEGGKHSLIPYRMSNLRFREILEYPADRDTIWTHDEMKPEWQRKIKFPGDCGRVYGAQWRNWNGSYDQIANLIHLLRTDPSSRYMKVTAWNPAEIGDMCLPPCHGDFQCFVEEVNGEQLLSLHMNQRSCDLFLGVPFNIASYGFLCHQLAHITNMVAKDLVITLNDVHVYEKHFEAVDTQLARTPGFLPRIAINPSIMEIDDFRKHHLKIVDYDPQAKIPAVLL